jgi:hypothetical protein
MSQENEELLNIEQINKLKAVHFADLIRACQLIYDPARGMSGISRQIDWKDYGIPDDVASNFKALGKEYQYSLPNVPPEVIWSKLSEESRVWFMENKEELWKFEDMYFPALDED